MLKSMDVLNKAFLAFRVTAALITAIIFVGLQFAPLRHFQIHPSPHSYLHAYADSVESSGQTIVDWVDPEQFTIRCDVREGAQWRYCGVSLKFSQAPRSESIVVDEGDVYGFLKAIDFSSYDHFLIDMSYDGPESYMRLFLRNAYEIPEILEQVNEQMFLNEVINKGEMFETIKLPISQFSVADWWAVKFQKSRIESVARFDQVFEIGIDFPVSPSLGVHDIGLQKIVAVGEYVNKETVYFGIIIFWFFVGFMELLRRWFRTMAKQKEMSSENLQLREQAFTDALTGLVNRHGTYKFIDSKFPLSNEDSVYIFLIDLDHFKKINDDFGHHVGDDVLKKTGVALQNAIRKSDLLGRWGGEEFLVICSVTVSDIEKVVNRLRTELAKVVVPVQNGDVLITMSIGITKVRSNETFDVALQRADQAVYEAKAAGRNTWKLI